MAFTGVNIAFSEPIAPNNTAGGSFFTVPYSTSAAETMSSAGTSSISASGNNEQSLLTINASAAIFYTTGPTPNINGTTVRYMDPANGPVSMIVNSGDFFAWEFST
jgi:hypothetical protein